MFTSSEAVKQYLGNLWVSFSGLRFTGLLFVPHGRIRPETPGLPDRPRWWFMRFCIIQSPKKLSLFH